MRANLLIASTCFALLVLPVLAQSFTTKSPSNELASNEVQSGSVSSVTTTQAANLSATAGAMPSRGMTMQQVEQLHGAPSVRKAAVGNPPITRWEYPGYVVYFEYRHVIHSVKKVN